MSDSSAGTRTRIWPAYVETWLQCKPLPYILHDAHSLSTGTRPAKPFDLHLAPELQLKKLVFSQGLPRKISAICDQRIAALQQECDSIGKPKGLRTLISDALEAPPDILAESGLVSDYITRTASPCLPLASMLAFGSNSNWEDIFEWKAQDSNNGAAALCDGFLYIGEAKDSPLSQTQRKDIDLIKKHRLGHLVISEFKSLVAGDLPTMQAIVALAKRGEFDWMSCNSRNHPVAGVLKCDAVKHSKNGILSVTGRTTGPDARGVWDESELFIPSVAIQMPDIDHKYYAKSYDIAQQVYAEMVNTDTTLAIISSGNMEILLKRDRATQTLHVSDIIYPHEAEDPTHYKLHTALYYVGYIDALDRARQIDEFLQSLKGFTSSGVPSPKWATKYLSNVYEEDSYYMSKVEMTIASGLSEYGIPDSKLEEREKMAKIIAEDAKDLFEELAKTDQVWIQLPQNKNGFEKPKLFRRKAVPHNNGMMDNLDPRSQGATDIPKLELVDRPSMGFRIEKCDSRSSSSVGVDNIHANFDVIETRLLSYETAGARLQIDMKLLPIVGGNKVYHSTISRFVSQNEVKFRIEDELVVKLAMNLTEKQRLLKDYEGHCRNPALISYGLFESVGKQAKCDVLLLQNGGRTLESLLTSKTKPKTKKIYLAKIKSGPLADLHSKGLRHNYLNTFHVLVQDNEKKRKFNLISYSEATEISALENETKEGPARKRAKILEDDTEHLWVLKGETASEV